MTGDRMMSDEVAVFVDLENLRYGLLNAFGVEPDFSAIVEKARKYGRPSVIRAYADFTEHPAEITRQLQVAGIEAINVPVKRSKGDRGGQAVERIKNAADMVLALDAMTEALDADSAGKVKVFLLVTGDADYIKLVTLLRNRFAQRVVVAGVPGSIANDLVRAANEEDPIAVPDIEQVDSHALKTAIVSMVARGPAPLEYWSLRIIDQWTQDPRQSIPGTAKQKRDVIGDLRREGVLVPLEFDHPTRGRTTRTDLDRDKARECGYLE